ncbi:transferrin [Agrilus planipennis]|uniref:Transferrin n=1 Tax=Agrilus planipennis TaxID=224129 RepID=A0A1W4X7C9_AGRPL|nr:transferrin [Agrilus planipennis]
MSKLAIAKNIGVLFFFFFYEGSVITSAVPLTAVEKFKVCVVDGRGSFKKASKYCPLLDQNANSKVECVIGLDRLDCLRKISKGHADWSIFTPEDLVTAQNSGVEMLITNEMRFTDDNFEYEVVAVINNDAGISSKHDLKDKKLCHPGYGYETDWTTILANYLESNVVPQKCIPSLTVMENKIKTSSDFFYAACKAGPWVNDPITDRQLKKKYNNLCALCGDRTECSINDKYWGRRGPLFCLTDGFGDVAWARLDDVRVHFNFTNNEIDKYSYLCLDGTVLPLNTSLPCTWVVKPWPVVATRRTMAQEIQQLVSSLTHETASSWHSTLLDLIESYHIKIVDVSPIEAVESYLDRAPGYLSANSFSGCHPPRLIRVCTTSNIENAKCGWLREAAAVYGIEPGIDCLKADNKTHCMSAVQNDRVDVVIISPDEAHQAKKIYDLKPLFYETVSSKKDKYLTVAITRISNRFVQFSDLKRTKSCFPTYDGIAFNTVAYKLRNYTSWSECKTDLELLSDFFQNSCIPSPTLDQSKRNGGCKKEFLDGGDFGALRCLISGYGDVAFVSKNSFENFFSDVKESKNNKVQKSDFQVLCDESEYGKSQMSYYYEQHEDWCHMSWATVGQAMVRNNSSDIWIKDTLDAFLQMDNLFGKNYRSFTNTMTMFGLFDGISDVLFHDTTSSLQQGPVSKNTDTMPRSYSDLLIKKYINSNNLRCQYSSSNALNIGYCHMLLLIFVLGFKVTSFFYV